VSADRLHHFPEDFLDHEKDRDGNDQELEVVAEVIDEIAHRAVGGFAIPYEGFETQQHDAADHEVRGQRGIPARASCAHKSHRRDQQE